MFITVTQRTMYWHVYIGEIKRAYVHYSNNACLISRPLFNGSYLRPPKQTPVESVCLPNKGSTSTEDTAVQNTSCTKCHPKTNPVWQYIFFLFSIKSIQRLCSAVRIKWPLAGGQMVLLKKFALRFLFSLLFLEVNVFSIDWPTVKRIL